MLFETLFLILLEGNLFVIKQDKASKDTFFISSNISIHLRSKNQSSKIEKCHTGGGSEMSQKSVTNYY
jgi:hypothetical protein